MVTTPQSGLFSITHCKRLRVSNLTVDYHPLPMTQGRVVAVRNATEYTLEIDAGFPSLMLPVFLESTKWVLIKDKQRPTVHKLGTRNLNIVTGWKDLTGDGRLFDVTLGGMAYTDAEAPKLGDPVVHVARYDQYPTFGVEHCDHCGFDGISIHASPSASWTALFSDGLTVRDSAVVPKPGRWQATNADGVFVLDSRIGPVQ